MGEKSPSYLSNKGLISRIHIELKKIPNSKQGNQWTGHWWDRHFSNKERVQMIQWPSFTPWITRVDSPDLIGWAGVPFLPHCSLCITLQSCTFSNRGEPVFSQGYPSSCALLLEPPLAVQALNEGEPSANIMKTVHHLESPGKCKGKLHWDPTSPCQDGCHHWDTKQQPTLVRTREERNLSFIVREAMESSPATMEISMETAVWPCWDNDHIFSSVCNLEGKKEESKREAILSMKGGRGRRQERVIRCMGMIKVYDTHTWNYHNETHYFVQIH